MKLHFGNLIAAKMMSNVGRDNSKPKSSAKKEILSVGEELYMNSLANSLISNVGSNICLASPATGLTPSAGDNSFPVFLAIWQMFLVGKLLPLKKSETLLIKPNKRSKTPKILLTKRHNKWSKATLEEKLRMLNSLLNKKFKTLKNGLDKKWKMWRIMQVKKHRILNKLENK